MRAHWFGMVAGMCLGMLGCSAYSVHPLYTGDSVVEPAVEGTWVGNDKTEFRVEKASAHDYSVAVTADNGVMQSYSVRLVRLGGQLFADMVFEHQTLNGAKLDDPAGTVPMHVILKVSVSGDQLLYAALDKDAILKANQREAKPIEHMMMDDVLLVTAPTESLQQFVSAHASDAFSDFDQLTRKAAPKSE